MTLGTCASSYGTAVRGRSRELTLTAKLLATNPVGQWRCQQMAALLLLALTTTVSNETTVMARQMLWTDG
jgi:hypothetical protein